MYCLYEMFLSTISIVKGNKVDVYFYLQMGMVRLDFEKNYKRTGPRRRQFICLTFRPDRAEKNGP